MGITKILLQENVRVGSQNYAVLIPLPANPDVCMRSVGITDFGDGDDQWDADFCYILESLVGGKSYHVAVMNPQTLATEVLETKRLADIQGVLAYNDHMNLVIVSGARSISFTRGHEIMWLNGFQKNELSSLRFPVEIIHKAKLAELF